MAMNREWVLQNLRETIEHIESAIVEVEKGNDYGFKASIEFIYRDLNRAWNGRETKDARASSGDDSLIQFPTDIDFDNPW